MHAIQSSWMAFDAMTHLQPIHDEPGYQRRVALMNSLLDVAGNDEDHALSGLLERVGDLVSRYEREHDPIEPASPKDSLLFFAASAWCSRNVTACASWSCWKTQARRTFV